LLCSAFRVLKKRRPSGRVARCVFTQCTKTGKIMPKYHSSASGH
jgi:hypothetical protein